MSAAITSDSVATALLHELSELTEGDVIDITETYGTHNYNPLPVSICRAEGAVAYDHHGKDYIDCIGCYSAVANGHLCKSVVDSMKAQLDRLTLISRAVYAPEAALFLRELCEFTDMDMCCPMNTGAEAVETAIKLARKWAVLKKGVPDGSPEIIVAENNFHGRTTTIVGFSSEPGFKFGFGPFSPGFVSVPFGDLDAVANAITPNTAAVLMEPIQIEGGIVFPPDGYMAKLRRLCTQNNVLLIWDEVQTGFYRSGPKFAWQHEDAKPDVMCLGKALGGGVFPVSAAVGNKDVMSVFGYGDHGSTFGGNPLGAVVAIAAMRDMEANDLGRNSVVQGERLHAGLCALEHPLIANIRGKGLLVGMEIAHSANAYQVGDALLHAGLLTKQTSYGTFRFTPPLVINAAQVDQVVARVNSALESVSQSIHKP